MLGVISEADLFQAYLSTQNKIIDLEKRLGDEEKRFDDADTKFGKTKFDASDITRTPNFQAWLRLYEKGDPLAKENPYHDEFEEILFSDLKGRDQSYKQMVGKKDGGRMGLKDGSKKSGFGAQSVKYGLDKNYGVTKADKIAKFVSKKNKKKII